jgi:iron complex outermembrane receptor protein
MKATSHYRLGFLACTALVSTCLLNGKVMAQSALQGGHLEEIIVTAQKREQNLQDVPVAVTAVTQDKLTVNRIFTVNDLSSMAPGLTVRPSSGGISTPAFTMRGQVSYGVVAGSDKQISVYVDGVYISSPRGSIFELPDIERLEVLRGPQGTLFGRNATAGAVSVTTRDPSGNAHVKVQGTTGNYDLYRVRASIDTPQVGKLSGYFSFVRDYRRGAVANTGVGTVWDRTLSPSGFGIQTSPKWLGTVDSNSYFAAVKFDANDNLKVVYKFDHNDDNGTPDANSIIGYDPTFGGGLLGNFVGALLTSNNVSLNQSAKRPSSVSNGWTTPRKQKVEGHSLTATWAATDNLTVKNILAYRRAEVFSPSPIDGVSSLTFTPQGLGAYATFIAFSSIGRVPGIIDIPSAIAAIPGIAAANAAALGKRFLFVASEAASKSKQYSDELQVNYQTDKLQATAGALWFHSNDEAGGPEGMQNTLAFNPLQPLNVLPTSGVIPLGNEGRYFNKATSLAAYAQLEYKIMPDFEVVGGGRVTHDKKTSAFRYNILSPAGTISPRPLIVPPDYKKTKPNFLIGLNYKPTTDMLLYAKYSTSFVSGGSTAGIVYEPETASSVEAGIKADFLDHRLRTNLALFHVDYNHFQSPQSTSSPQSAAIALASMAPLYGLAQATELLGPLSTFVIDQGKVRAQGFELEVTAAPTQGLTVGSSVGYTDVKFPYINPVVLAANGGSLAVMNRPRWTASVFTAYETPPIIGDIGLMFRADGLYKSKVLLNQNFRTETRPQYLVATYVPAYMLVNARIATTNLKVGGAEVELAFWIKNLTNRKDMTAALFTPYSASAGFIDPRTYGAELSFDF